MLRLYMDIHGKWKVGQYTAWADAAMLEKVLCLNIAPVYMKTNSS